MSEVECPVCGLGRVAGYRVPPRLDGAAFRMCGECEAVWEQGQDIDRDFAEDLLGYLRDRGLQPWLEDLERERAWPAVAVPEAEDLPGAED
ncbi:hypothetical protein [Nocardiopsis composta]|uniref:Uncharacterized protein n=1 Tax=Nocardiopsis composta TaxID=157465 RepID=A0A7W8QL66_9ACTN|nr:hypothetical protein [Nocardiopsis composta]MBB5432320.1 hypothetical protein [Nocardiopsis composta]